MLNLSSEISFKKDYPEEWERLMNGDNYIYTNNGIFALARVHLNDKLDKESAELIVLNEGYWLVVTHVPAMELRDYAITLNSYQFFDFIMNKYLFYFISLILLSLILSFFWEQNKIVNDKIKYYSEFDEMTNMYNRRAGLNLLSSRISHYRKNDKDDLCIVYIDINGIKEINDKLGHHKGDELIVTISDTIIDSIRKSDFLIRMGGDEFVVVMNDTDKIEADLIWKRISNRFNKINKNESRLYNISASHGLVHLCDYPTQDVDTLIKIADSLMYEEKQIIKSEIKIIK